MQFPHAFTFTPTSHWLISTACFVSLSWSSLPKEARQLWQPFNNLELIWTYNTCNLQFTKTLVFTNAKKTDRCLVGLHVCCHFCLQEVWIHDAILVWPQLLEVWRCLGLQPCSNQDFPYTGDNAFQTTLFTARKKLYLEGINAPTQPTNHKLFKARILASKKQDVLQYVHVIKYTVYQFV